MADNTMSLTIYAAPGTRAEFIVDGATKEITLDLKHHPKPAQAIAIPEPLAAPLVNLALHRTDLWRAREFLDEFDRQGGVPAPESNVQQNNQMNAVFRALWLAALGSTMKCFQHSQSRSATLLRVPNEDHGRRRAALPGPGWRICRSRASHLETYSYGLRLH
jgi:hypothetical protein